jgi:hypothetical protein
MVERFQRPVCTVPRRAGLNEDQVSDVFQDVCLVDAYKAVNNWSDWSKTGFFGFPAGQASRLTGLGLSKNFLTNTRKTGFFACNLQKMSVASWLSFPIMFLPHPICVGRAYRPFYIFN